LVSDCGLAWRWLTSSVLMVTRRDMGLSFAPAMCAAV